MAGQLRGCADRVVAEEHPPRYRKPGVAPDIGVAEKSGKALPVRNLDLPLGSINNRLSKSDGEADCRAQDLIVVGIIIHVAAEIVRVNAKLAEKTLGCSQFEIVSVRRFDRQAQNVGV